MTTHPRLSLKLGAGLTAAALSISILSGCAKVTEIQQLPDAASTAVGQLGDTAEGLAETATGDQMTAESFDRAIAAISERVGADPIQVVEVIITEYLVTVQAIDPNAPTELNQWTYTAGQVPESRPVDYGDDAEALQQNLFPVTEVPASAVTTAIDNALTAGGIADGAVQSIVVKRNLPFSDEVQILLNVQGERSSKQVRADRAGNVTGVI